MKWIDILDYQGPFAVASWMPALWAAAVFLLTRRLASREFYIGGVIAGSALLYATSAIFLRVLPEGEHFELLMFCTVLLFQVTGFIVHWFVRIEHRIAYDPLLQIYNRDYCMQIISERSSVNCAPPFTLAMIDIDHFKKVNDTYGHQAGDEVLHAVAQTVKKAVMPHGVLCRYGGEELAIFFSQKTSSDVKAVVEKARKAVEETKVVSGKHKLSVTISGGVSHRTAMNQPIADIVTAADKALYKAKEGGRNQIKIGKIAESVPAKKK